MARAAEAKIVTAREDDWISENLRRNPDAKIWADIERGEPADREIENEPEPANETAMPDHRSPNREWLKDAQINDSALSEPVDNKSQGNQHDAASTEKRLLQSSAEFIAAYEPPDYLIDGLLQRRFCYSLTAHTGRGKTAIALLIAAHVALGRPLAGREIENGRVLMFAGENPTDVCQRWIAMSEQMDFDANTIQVYFIPGRFKISDLIARIRAEVAALGDMALLIIDTSAAYFEGDDENNNVQLGKHASNVRELRIPGGPTTIINCHPTKNASDDNLLPRGAGAFLAEVDGNLTLKLDDTAIEMHWQGKFRGADFAPMSFQLHTVTHERLKDTRGRPISTVIARPLSDTAQEELAKAIRSDEDQLLQVIAADPKASLAELARTAGWFNKQSEPLKAKAQRTVDRLKKAKLIAQERREYIISDKGAKILSELKKKEECG
jgi:AAA domain